MFKHTQFLPLVQNTFQYQDKEQIKHWSRVKHL